MDMVASFHCSTQHGVFNVHAGATNFYSNIHTAEASAGLCWQVVLPLRKCRSIIHVRYFSSLQTPHPSFSFFFFFFQFLQLSQLTGAVFQFSPSGKHAEKQNNFCIYMHGGIWYHSHVLYAHQGRGTTQTF